MAVSLFGIPLFYHKYLQNGIGKTYEFFLFFCAICWFILLIYLLFVGFCVKRPFPKSKKRDGFNVTFCDVPKVTKNTPRASALWTPGVRFKIPSVGITC